MAIKPLNNHLLVEVIEESHSVLYDRKEEQFQKGKVLTGSFCADHITMSAGYQISDVSAYADLFNELVGKVVYWGQYADSGQVFEQDGKKLALIPFFRVVGYED